MKREQCQKKQAYRFVPVGAHGVWISFIALVPLERGCHQSTSRWRHVFSVGSNYLGKLPTTLLMDLGIVEHLTSWNPCRISSTKKNQYFLKRDFLALLGWQSWMQKSAQHLGFQVTCLETPESPKNKSTKFVCHRLSICKKDIHQQRQETMFNLIVQERPPVISQSKLGLGWLIFDQPRNDLTHCPGLASGTGVAGAGAGAGTAGLDAASAPSTAPLDSS